MSSINLSDPISRLAELRDQRDDRHEMGDAWAMGDIQREIDDLEDEIERIAHETGVDLYLGPSRFVHQSHEFVLGLAEDTGRMPEILTQFGEPEWVLVAATPERLSQFDQHYDS